MLFPIALLFMSMAADETPPPCAQISAEQFQITGPIDEAMAQCVSDTLASTTTEVILDSGGGDIEIALDIAERLAPLGAVMRVRNRCYSSCANYFIPVGRRLVVEPGATIVLHGGADPLLLHDEFLGARNRRLREIRSSNRSLSTEEVEARFEQSVERIRRQIERQRAFAERHDVGLGWFIYRESASDFGPHLEGEAGPKPHPFGWRLLLAEEPLVRSCLPNLEVEPYQRQLETDFINNAERYARFRRAEGRRSMNLSCGAAASG
jgi:hypothetical protein